MLRASLETAAIVFVLMTSSIGLAACAGIVRVGEPTSSTTGAAAVGELVVLTGARGFAAAELAYITAADATGRLARAGVIRGTLAARLRGWNAEARRMLVVGHATTDAAEQARAAAALFGLADRLKTLEPR